MVCLNSLSKLGPVFAGRNFSELVELQLTRHAEVWEASAGAVAGASTVAARIFGNLVILPGPGMVVKLTG